MIGLKDLMNKFINDNDRIEVIWGGRRDAFEGFRGSSNAKSTMM